MMMPSPKTGKLIATVVLTIFVFVAFIISGFTVTNLNHQIDYTLPPNADREDILTRLKTVLNDRTPKTGQPYPPPVWVYDSRDVNQSLSRVTRYFTSFMGLVSVVALFLAGVATAYLFRGYIQARQHQIAVLMSMGASLANIYLYAVIQLVVLGFVAWRRRRRSS